ncbi:MULTISPECIES: hypothetical protein [unclassified Herbaspirillum]|uniref:hypothetical protein n=1 Tax=unclassified Herbaspirillum TaxID=2624150 RepID=UPI000E2F7B1C|nr:MULTISPECIES: hypothetical protein [unclassified Herbaspirillum]RFB69905.1 hypothetical protein DZB54_14815 [Herbaspirillum sp. 3R-3a1]TFI07030.1 hypothetical protein E4P32_13985 [Herbaspirillum sp. 3R11]TFI12968.1 hypothetical protein E4P31_19110 [Herbaspirillum sp. 3R-11]TFI19209.1 hypothetical protein E4P30_25195 [Herbaspirillum sp. 3C11]
MDKKLTWVEVVLLIACFAATFAVIGMAFAHFTHEVDKDKVGDAATWVGAIFAAAAFCGTIYLATKESRDSLKEKSDTAIVLAAGMIERIGAAKRAVKAVDSWIVDAILDIEEHPDPDQFAQANLRPFAEKVHYALLQCPEFTVDELKGIIILPNHCAAHLAATAQRIRVIRDDAKRLSDGMADASLKAMAYLSASRGNLATCIISFGVAERECRIAIADLNADLLSRDAKKADVG